MIFVDCFTINGMTSGFRKNDVWLKIIIVINNFLNYPLTQLVSIFGCSENSFLIIINIIVSVLKQ